MAAVAIMGLAAPASCSLGAQATPSSETPAPGLHPLPEAGGSRLNSSTAKRAGARRGANHLQTRWPWAEQLHFDGR
eukprot:4662353-Alexandrium_andersonii.AAC.1